jgi:hypothetical protein
MTQEQIDDETKGNTGRKTWNSKPQSIDDLRNMLNGAIKTIDRILDGSRLAQVSKKSYARKAALRHLNNHCRMQGVLINQLIYDRSVLSSQNQELRNRIDSYANRPSGSPLRLTSDVQRDMAELRIERVPEKKWYDRILRKYAR